MRTPLETLRHHVTGAVERGEKVAITEQPDVGYLQHGTQPGPFRTESVRLKHEAPDNWSARFEGKWRKVHVQVNRTFIVCQGARITIMIDGV